MESVPDPVFAEPRLAEVYDPLDPDRSDLDAYVAMVDEFGAHSVLDIGCGTGTLACMLALKGIKVTGLDPAAASLEVAKSKPGADRVRWIQGAVTRLPPLQVDLVLMTGNVAQVFLTDSEWVATLQASVAALESGGHLVFETRDPSMRAWEDWTKTLTYSEVEIPDKGLVASWHELEAVDGELVTFLSSVVFESDGARFESRSTLRFRSRESIEGHLLAAGFSSIEVRDAPDRPGREFVFVARRN